MKSKNYLKTFFVILLLLLVFNTNNVNAADAVSMIKIKTDDNGSSRIGGYSYLHWMAKETYYTTVLSSTYSSAKIYTSAQNAKDACARYAKNNSNVVCKSFTADYASSYTCYGTKYSSYSTCRNATYPKSVKTSGTCSKVFLSKKYKCTLSGSTKNGVKYADQATCNNNCYKYTTQQVKCSTNTAYCKYTNNSKYAYTYQLKSEIENQREYWTRGLKALIIPKYSIVGSSDPTYCIQPGNKGPGSGTDYCLNTEIDLSKCESLTDPDHYYCGLAAILYQTVKEDGTYADGSTKYVDNGQYSYAAITTALRMWVAYYSGLSGVDTIGMESDGFTYISNTNVYKITAKHLINNPGYKNGVNCTSSLQDGLLCTYNSKTDYINGLKLFAAAKEGGITFLDNEEAKLHGPKFSSANQPSSGDVQVTTVKVTMPEKYIEKMVPCTKAEILNKNSACKVYIEVRDAKGNKVDSSIQDAYCEKEFCEVTLSAQRKECSKTGGTIESTSYKVSAYLKEFAAGGYVRQYVNCADPNNSQVMMTFAFNQKRKEIEGDPLADTSAKFEYTVTVPCYCDPDKRCNAEDMVPSQDLPETCSGQGVFDSGEYDTYTVGDKKDPYMNCILNACDPAEKKKYNYSSEYGVNTKVCEIYCRDEIYFYMANKTRVYAGMQFQYDIVPKLQADGVIEEPYINKVGKSDYKLSSVVLQKRQCTTEIYYDIKNADGKTWLDQYDEAVKDMVSKYNNWKKHESTYDWEVKDNGGKPDEVTIPGVQCYRGTGCPGYCTTSTYLNPIDYYLYWPDEGSSESYNYYNIQSGTGENKGVEFTLSQQSSTHSTSSGRENSASGCKSTECNCSRCPCPTESNPNKTCKCNCDYGDRTTGTCKAGQAGDYSTAKNAESSAWNAYKTAADKVAQLIYDLQNCNLYVAASGGHTSTAPVIQDYYSSKIPTRYHGTNSGSITRAKGNSSKDYILEQSSCKTAEECVELEVEYDDDNYGEIVEFPKEVGLVDSDLNGTYHCKNADDSDPNCYKYIRNTEVEINAKNYGSDKKKQHDIVYCDANTRTDAKCWTEKKNLPTNDFATFITVTEADFWQPKKYQTQVYTGIVSVGDGSDDGYTALDDFVYPVSNNNKTGSTGVYDIEYHFSNITLKSSADLLEYDHTCSYDVLNTTKLYDCEIKIDGTGNLDLSDCQNSCYDIKNGVPIIRDECNSWDEDDGKGYGFIYRNVEVGNLFPNGLRGIGTNWDEATSAISAIESTASSVYYNDDYLEYKYVLTPNAINRIRDYNQNQDSNGGYLNLTLSGCDKVDLSTGLQAFYNCKSSFLGDISQPSNSYGVKPIKTDGQATGGGN